MVLTDKDIATKPIIKKPRTFNPLGGVFTGLFLGIGHALLNKSFIKNNVGLGIGVLGIILIILSVAPGLVAISLSPKFAIFNTIVEKSKNIVAQITFQIILFYVGFLPIYGLAIVYTTGNFDLWKLLVLGAIHVVFVAGLFLINHRFLTKEKPSISNLQKPLFQPNKILLILLSFLPSAISTLVLFML
ncbi:MAG: hypothetical protein H7641_04290 [Candidatus Heimdallarchaeota archaeon]|nr:hypothetical protein [Candidatus Heimdallarchaeota archaeon]MCK4876781.1 hypothetical protein [Candidatus Heimdallarchaeota archaeon]